MRDRSEQFPQLLDLLRGRCQLGAKRTTTFLCVECKWLIIRGLSIFGVSWFARQFFVTAWVLVACVLREFGRSSPPNYARRGERFDVKRFPMQADEINVLIFN